MGRFYKNSQGDPPPLGSAVQLFSAFGLHGNGALGPSSSIVTGNNDIFNTGINLTGWGYWLNAYGWWRADSGQPSGAQKFCIYQSTGSGGATLLTPGTVTSSQAFTAGAWNYVPLSAPVNLSKGIAYRLATGLTGNFPFTSGYFGTGGPGVGGITSGPLNMYSDTGANGGTDPELHSLNQCTFSSVAGTDPTTGIVTTVSSSFNAWLDALISNTPPAGAQFQLFPNQPVPETQALDTATNFTLGVEVVFSRQVNLNQIAFYSPATVTQLPTEVGVWTVPGQTLVAATHQTSPVWSGLAASGWVTVNYSGVTLPAGEYKITVFNGAATPAIWNASTAQYWSTGAGGSGIVNGPLSAPNNANATSPGQSSYHQGTSFTFPDTNTGPFNYWVDVVVS